MKKTDEQRQAEATTALFTGYLEAAKYLRDVAANKSVAMRDRVKVCMFLVEQERGRAKQMIEASGKVTLEIIEDA